MSPNKCELQLRYEFLAFAAAKNGICGNRFFAPLNGGSLILEASSISDIILLLV